MFPSIFSTPTFQPVSYGSNGTSTNLAYPSITSAIADFEGYNTAGSVAQRNNNPGNLIYGNFAQQYGAVGQDPSGFAIFPTPQSGLQRYANSGYSLSELIDAWSPPSAPGNSPRINQNYVSYISQKTGINPDVPISGQETSFFGDALSNMPGAFLNTIPGIGALNGLGGLLGGLGIKNPITDFTAGFSWARVAAFILGILFIAAGLYQFKAVQEVVQPVITTAKEGATAALAA